MQSLINFKLIFISDSSLNNNFLKIADQACRAGVKAVQLREKNIPAKKLLELSRKLRTITKKYNSRLLINDRYDVALLSKADGLHSPESGINPGQIRNKNKLIFGKSVHSLKSAKEAEELGFDYLIFGPVFKTPSKVRYGKPQGLNKLKIVCRSVNIPVFAVGGIDPFRAEKCIKAGAHGVAVIREILLSKNIRRTVHELINSVRSGDQTRQKQKVHK